MKGVSPLLEAVLLIAVAVTISVLVATWLTTLTTSETRQVKNTTTTALQCQFSNLLIQSATYNCSLNCSAGISHNLTLTLKNTGRISIDIRHVSLLNKTGSIYAYEFNETKILDPGETIVASNISTDSCMGINRTIEKITVASISCPKNAFDSISGGDVVLTSCG
ncbi:hypothetical protein HY501_00860 [Candidatus Woesearchaeota archaeon]|nr:hypothetical protein [Candidatus Woesearchaeota archaeon]